MKVTVCFGELKVVVPCGDGDFLVSELIERAVTRYKKASGKPGDFWVKVHALKNQRDGGILDLDDALNDVVDDKDLILAEFDEQRIVSSPEQGEGDGTSCSSVGSTSPDLRRERLRTVAREQPPAATAPTAVPPPPAVAGSNGRVPETGVASTATISIGTDATVAGGSGSVLQQVARLNGHLVLGGKVSNASSSGGPPAAAAAAAAVAGRTQPAAAAIGRTRTPAPPPPPKPTVSSASVVALAAASTPAAPKQQQPPPPPLASTLPLSPQQPPQQSPLSGNEVVHSHTGSRSSVVVTETDLTKATGLHVLRVRRGSESNLVSLPLGGSAAAARADAEVGEAGTLLKSEAKQWLPRVVPAQQQQHQLPPPPQQVSSSQMHEISTEDSEEDDGRNLEGWGRLTKVATDPSRRSLTSESVLKWTAAAATAAADAEDLEHNAPMRSRHEPVGQSSSPNISDARREVTPVREQQQHAAVSDETVLLALDGSTPGPLGIHVVPNIVNGRSVGLVIQNIERGGRIDQDGRFSVYDLIEEINGRDITMLSFEDAQDVFRQALMTKNVLLRIRKNGGAAVTADEYDYYSEDTSEAVESSLPDVVGLRPATFGDASFEKGNSWQGELHRDSISAASTQPAVAPVPAQRPAATLPQDGASSVAPTLSPPQPLAHQPASRSPSAQLTSPTNTLMKGNTRKIGKKLTIELLKGPEGLGFSITTRDNPAGGVAPIYVKNILPKGAAIVDGRLKSGDRLLEINGIDTTSKSQDEAVAMLRNTKRGSIVSLVVSRQEVSEQPTTLPRQLLPAYEQTDSESASQAAGGSSLGPSAIAAPAGKQLHVFDIPLNESGSAGLGVSVKGKTSTTEEGQICDLGIFVKTVIHGGAASKDGRVMVNDQLVEVNGELLVDKTNAQAMETLRRAMMTGTSSQIGHIKLVVARTAPGGADGYNGAVATTTASRSLASTPEPFLNRGELRIDTPVPADAARNGSVGDSRRPSQGSLIDSKPESSPVAASRQRPQPQQPVARRLDAAATVSTSKLEKGGVVGGSAAAAAAASGLRNPVLDRLTGNAGVRLDAGGRGGSDDYDDDDEASGGSSSGGDDPSAQLYGGNATTLPTPQAPRDTVIIEDDSQPVVQRRERGSSGSDFTKVRPYSAIGGIGLLAGLDNGAQGAAALTSTQTITESGGPGNNAGDRAGTDKLLRRESTMSSTAGTFEREGFGRRSFSEKRKVEKNKELVERAKALRDDAKEKDDGRAASRSLYSKQAAADWKQPALAGDASRDARLKSHEPLDAKLSASSDDLRFAGAGDDVQSRASRSTGSGALWRPSTQGPRGRACNESFRAAVDKSYDGPPGGNSGRAAQVMSIGNGPSSARRVQEEGSDSGLAAAQDSSTRSSFSDRGAGASSVMSTGSDRASDSNKGQKKEKKTTTKVASGGFLGNLLRFTKGRKSMDDRLPSRTSSSASSSAELHGQSGGPGVKPGAGVRLGAAVALQPPGGTRLGAADAATDRSKIDERYRRLQDSQRAQLVAKASIASTSSSASGSSTAGGSSALHLRTEEQNDYAEIPAREQQQRTASPSPYAELSLAANDKAARLRQEYHERHVRRQGRYPQDEREDFYEQRIREREAREWEANNRANMTKALDPNWRVQMMIERGGSESVTPLSHPPGAAAPTTNSGIEASVPSSHSRSGGGSRPFLYEANAPFSRPAASSVASSDSNVRIVSAGKLQPQHGGSNAVEADFSSLTRHPRARTPEPQPWKRQQQPPLQQQLQGPPNLSYALPSTAAARSSPALQTRVGHQRYASLDATRCGGDTGSWPSSAGYHDYDDPRHAYVDHRATIGVSAAAHASTHSRYVQQPVPQLQMQPVSTMGSNVVRRSLTGSAQV